jgi:chromosome partitioning protein
VGLALNDAYTVALANLRAGVGKTSLTLSLGTTLAERGHRVLLVDLDPQASLTVACGVEDAADVNLSQVMGGSMPGRTAFWDILKEIVPGQYIFLAPADIALAHAEYGLSSRMAREHVLGKALEGVKDNFDFILLDCPSSLGLLTLNGLAAADTIIIPSQPHMAHLRGIWLFLGTIERIKRELNPELSIMGIVLTYFNGELAHHQNVLSSMKAGGLPILPVAVHDDPSTEADAEDGGASAIYVPGSYQALSNLARLVEETRRAESRNGRMPQLRLTSPQRIGSLRSDN